MLTTFANIRILEREELSRHVTQCWQTFLKMVIMEDFPGGLVVKTPCYQCRGTGLIPGQGSSTCLKGCGRKEKKKIVIMERVWVWKSERPGVQTQAVPTSAVKWALTPCWACVGTGSSRGDQQGAPSRKTTKAALPSRVGFGHASPPARNSADPLLVQRGLCFVFQLRQFPLWEARLLPHFLVIFNTPVPQLHL